MTFSRWLFALAALYGVVALVPMYFQESMIATSHPPPLTHPEYYYGFIGVALAWQVAFVIIAAEPVRHRSLMIPAVLEKFGFGAAAVALHLEHRLSPLMLAAGCVDLLFAVLFVLAWWRLRTSRSRYRH